MHEQQKPVTFRETVNMIDLFLSAQYLEVEGAVGNGGRPGNVNHTCNLLQRHIGAAAEDYYSRCLILIP